METKEKKEITCLFEDMNPHEHNKKSFEKISQIKPVKSETKDSKKNDTGLPTK